MSTRELLYMQCDRCGAELGSRRHSVPHDVGQWSTAYYTSHTEAIRAAEAAGWRCQSESIGGDVCAACVEKEQSE